MTDRETIIDLLQDVQAKGFWSYGTDMYTGEEGGHFMPPDLIADYLMENGVTVQWWFPVDELLPELESYTYSVDVLFILESGDIHTGYLNYETGRWKSREINRTFDTVTHWMPLPKPPKGDKRMVEEL